jgi:hypothetical protein
LRRHHEKKNTKIAAPQFASQKKKTKIVSPHFASQKKPNNEKKNTKIAAPQFASQKKKTKIVSPHFANQKKPFQHHNDSPHFFAEGKWRHESQLGRRITTQVSGEDQNDQVPKTKTGNQPIVLEQQQDQKQMKRHWNQKNDELSSSPKPKIKQASIS